MPDPVVRDAAQLRPLAERAHRGFFALGENAGEAETEDIGEFGFQKE